MLDTERAARAQVEKLTTLTVSGYDKGDVGQFAAKIREKRPPEPYKGKGIRYVGEYGGVCRRDAPALCPVGARELAGVLFGSLHATWLSARPVHRLCLAVSAFVETALCNGCCTTAVSPP